MIKRYKKASFRGIEFNCSETSTDSGRRLANHEFPLYDKPFAQDMGRKQTAYKLSCYVAGENWETQRDRLLEACSTQGSGKLIHPDFGELMVQIAECSVRENKQEEVGISYFDLSFYETFDTKSWLGVSEDTAASVKNSAKKTIFSVSKAFSMVFKLTQLPQLAADYVMEQIGDVIGISNPYVIMSAINAAQNLLNGDITLPWQVPVLISAFTSVFNFDYSDEGSKLIIDDGINTIHNYNPYIKQDPYIVPEDETTPFLFVTEPETLKTYQLSPESAYNLYNKMLAVPVNHISAISGNTALQRKSGKQVELLLKSCCAIEASVALTEIDIHSDEDAVIYYNEMTEHFDTLIDLASEINDRDAFRALTEHKLKVKRDLLERAPNLAKVIKLNITIPTSVLLISYNNYESVDKSSDIIARNKIKHPAFIQGSNIKILK